MNDVYNKNNLPKSRLAKLAYEYFKNEYGEDFTEMFYSRSQKLWFARYGQRTYYDTYGAQSTDNFKEISTDYLLSQVEAEVMQKRFIKAYKQPEEKTIVGIQYYDEQNRRCTMFVDTCGNKHAMDTLIELIKLTA